MSTPGQQFAFYDLHPPMDNMSAEVQRDAGIAEKAFPQIFLR